MTGAQWALILGLAAATYALRLSGLLLGDALERRPRLRTVLRDLPGCLVVALVAASLAVEGAAAWIAAAVALGVAVWTNHVIATMGAGVAAFMILQAALG